MTYTYSMTDLKTQQKQNYPNWMPLPRIGEKILFNGILFTS